MIRTLAIFLSLLLLWAVMSRLNDALAVEHISLFAGGLFVTYAALFLPLSEGLGASLLAGGVCDANAPVWFGTHVLLFAAATVVLFSLRERLPHDQPAGRVGIALMANAAIFAAISLLQFHGPGARLLPWPRLAADLAFSEIFLALAAPWFFALQAQTLSLVPRDPGRMY